MQPGDTPKLTWSDLIIDNLTSDEVTAWLGDWQWLDLGRIAPIFVSRFGDWFFHRPDGSIHTLNIEAGAIQPIASNFEEFKGFVNTPEWQESHLFNFLLLKYRDQGIVATNRQAIGYVPHPAFAKSLDVCKVMVMDMRVWQSICGQMMRQVRGVGKCKGVGNRFGINNMLK